MKEQSEILLPKIVNNMFLVVFMKYLIFHNLYDYILKSNKLSDNKVLHLESELGTNLNIYVITVMCMQLYISHRYLDTAIHRYIFLI